MGLTHASAAHNADSLLVAALRCGDEAAFIALVRRYHGLMLRVAYAQIKNRAACEEVVQETWLTVIKRVRSFEGRSSLRATILRILSHQASARLERDGRKIAFSALASAEAAAAAGPSVKPSRFLPHTHPQRPFSWVSDPHEWPNEALLADDIRSVICTAVEQLPDCQRVVINLRDVEGWTSGEVGEALEISDTNQRVLLHRARSTVRDRLDEYVRRGRR